MRYRLTGFVLAAFVFIFWLSCQKHKSAPIFDENQAYKYLVEQCDFGPRNPNSLPHDKCGQYLYDRLAATTTVCRRQQFDYYDDVFKDTLKLTNIIASYNPKSQRRILLCAHWDSRPWADKDPDSNVHNQPILGANDGASGVAILLTIAEAFNKQPPPLGVDIVLLDGEDYGREGQEDKWLLGSQYFVKNIDGYNPICVVLLDMVGDSDLQIYKEYYSSTYAGWLVNRIWKAASIEKAEHFYPDIKHTVYDDHIPFLKVGIPAVDLIDMDYKYWHTLGDTPDKCSAKSLGEVGRVILRLIFDQDLSLESK
jgi:glutaminyl-peptide cyclotransferase